jgi:ABC-2 type transport system permease protein
MHTILTLIRKDFANFWRDKTAVALTFLVPIALIYIFGQVFGLNRKDIGPTGVRLAVVNESEHPAAKRLVTALGEDKAFRIVTKFTEAGGERALREADVRSLMRQDEFRYALILPRNLIATDRVGVHFKILSNPRNDIESQTVLGLLQRSLLVAAPELLGQSLQSQAHRFLGDARWQEFNSGLATAVANAFGGDKEAIQKQIASGQFLPGNNAAGGAGNNTPAARDALADLIHFENEQVAGKSLKNPGASRLVGGWAIMFLMFALSAAAAAFFDEKKAGLFQRLLSAPVHRWQLLWSRYLYGVILGVAQLILLFFTGRLLYGIEVMSYFGNLLLVCAAAAAACTSLGMLIAAFSPSSAAANGLASFVILIMSAVGGAWFPVSFMPEFMQHLAKFTVVFWSVEGFTRVLWDHFSFVELLPTLGILLAIAAGIMSLAVWRFNRSRIFE